MVGPKPTSSLEQPTEIPANEVNAGNRAACCTAVLGSCTANVEQTDQVQRHRFIKTHYRGTIAHFHTIYIQFDEATEVVRIHVPRYLML